MFFIDILAFVGLRHCCVFDQQCLLFDIGENTQHREDERED